MGVMNGTCNYILTRMESAGLAYAEVFEEARQPGYLEADPNLDVGGIDARHKLSLLAALAFGLIGFGPMLWLGMQTSVRQIVTPPALMGRGPAHIPAGHSRARPPGAGRGVRAARRPTRPHCA